MNQAFISLGISSPRLGSCCSKSWTNSVIPKVCSAEMVRESLYKFVLRGPPKYSKWSAHLKSLGTAELIKIVP